jgi:hypothetical protein
MKIKCKVVEYKTVSPLFEMERDGLKLFTVRRIERGDPRVRSLSHASFVNWLIKITNPATGEYFYRELIGKSILEGPGKTQLSCWMILYMGTQIKEE